MKQFTISLPPDVPKEEVALLNKKGNSCGYHEFGNTLSQQISSSHQLKESFSQIMENLHDLRQSAIRIKQETSLDGYIDSFIAQSGVSIVGLLQVITDYHIERYAKINDWKETQNSIDNTWRYGELLFNEDLIDYFGYLHWSILKLNEDTRIYKSGNFGKALSTYGWLLDRTESYIGLSLDKLDSIRRKRKSDMAYEKQYYKVWATNLFGLMNHIYELNKSSFVTIPVGYRPHLEPARAILVTDNERRIIELSDTNRPPVETHIYFSDRKIVDVLEEERQSRMGYLLAIMKQTGIKKAGETPLSIDYHEFRHPEQ